MPLYLQTIALFSFNFADALLTIFWVRNGYATEGNHLMATLLDIGDLPFLLVKIAVGTVAAVVLWKWREFALAKYGLMIALILYTALMGIHFITGLSAMGLVAQETITGVGEMAGSALSLLI